MIPRPLATLAAAHAASDSCQGAIPAMLPFLVAERGYSYAAATALLLVATIGSSVIQPIFGHVADRFSTPWLMAGGLVVGGVGTGLVGVTTSYAGALVAAAVGGLGVAAFHPQGARYAGLVSTARPSTAISVFSVGGNAGFVLGPLVVTMGVALFGLGGTLLVAVAPALAGLAVIRETSLLARLQQRAGGLVAARRLGQADAWGPFARLSGLVVARTGVTYGLLAFVPLWFVAELGTDASIGNAAVAAMLAAGAVGTLIGGRLADSAGVRLVLVGAMAVLWPLTLLLPFAGVAGAFLLVAAIGFAMDANFGVTIALGQQYLPRRAAMASGIVLGLAVGLGGVVAAALGVLADHGGLAVALYGVAGFAFAALVLAISCPAPRGAPAY